MNKLSTCLAVAALGLLSTLTASAQFNFTASSVSSSAIAYTGGGNFTTSTAFGKTVYGSGSPFTASINGSNPANSPFTASFDAGTSGQSLPGGSLDVGSMDFKSWDVATSNLPSAFDVTISMAVTLRLYDPTFTIITETVVQNEQVATFHYALAALSSPDRVNVKEGSIFLFDKVFTFNTVTRGVVHITYDFGLNSAGAQLRTPGGQDAFTGADTSAITTGNMSVINLQYSPMTPVPEPSTYALMGASGLAALVGFRRFRSKKAVRA
jgi:hypothetical protein